MNKKIIITLLSALIILITSVVVYTYPGGITGRTKKTSTVGCSCHTNNTSITGTFSGPDTVITGQTVTYSFTITRSGSNAGGGCDIATRLGTLAVGPGSSYIQLLNGELTHIEPFTMVNGQFTGQFSYTAPATPGIDTLWLSEAVGHSNGWNWGTEKRIIVRSLTGISSNNTPVQFKLNQNYPNPFNPSTTISFELPVNSDVKISIFDIGGKLIETLVNNKMQAGAHEVTWNASAYASGVYIYKIETGTYSEVKKMMLIK
jgi:type IX secretion system substrate protein